MEGHLVEKGWMIHTAPCRDRGSEAARPYVNRPLRVWHGGIQQEMQGERLDLRRGMEGDDREDGFWVDMEDPYVTRTMNT